MTPVDVVIWSCVVIFIATAVLTLLHISGIRTLPNADHGKVLFRALVVEIVVIAVGAFAAALLPENTSFPETNQSNIGGLPGSMGKNQDAFFNPTSANKTEPLLPKHTRNTESRQTTNIGDENCHQITVLDASTLPPTSHIETICN